MVIREAHINDLEQIVDIYNWAVVNTTATFDIVPQTLESRRIWFSHYGGNYPLIVSEINGRAIGYASLSKFRDKEAYARTVEVSLYIHPDYHGKGIGKKLLAQILQMGRELGHHVVMAGITAGNDISVELHKKFGFVLCGNMKQLGWKFDKWQDVLFYQLILDSVFYSAHATKLGNIYVASTPKGLCQLSISENNNENLNLFKQQLARRFPNAQIIESESKNADIIAQLDEYFDGKRQTFDIELDLQGTDFQKKVWSELIKIPYGTTCTYLDIANKVGGPQHCRAVGGANNKNPIAIVVPCHRVIGSDKSLVGYAGGIELKKKLLQLENFTHFLLK